MDDVVAVILFAAAVLVGIIVRQFRFGLFGSVTARRFGALTTGVLLLLIVVGLTVAQFIGIDIGSTFARLRTDNPFTPENLAGVTDYIDSLLLLHPVSSTFLRFIALVGAVVLLDLGGRRSAAESRSDLLRMFGTLLGGGLIVFSNDLFILWSGVEILTMSLPPAVVENTPHRRRLPSLPGVSSFLALFGIVLMYSLFGTTSLRGIHGVLDVTNLEIVPSNPLLFSLLLIVGGLFTRLGLGYRRMVEGADPARFHAVVLGCATVAIAGFGLVVQISPGIFTPELRGIDAGALVTSVAGFVVLAGGLAAVRADSSERMLLFGLAAHSGVAILGATVAGAAGIVAGTLHLMLAVLSTVAVFPMISGFAPGGRQPGESSNDVGSSIGLFPAVSSGILLLTLAGIPLTGGFLSRLFMVGSVLGGPENLAVFGPDRFGSAPTDVSHAFLPVMIIAAGSILLLYIYGRLFVRLYLRARSGVEGAGFAGPFRTVVTAVVAVIAIGTGLPQGFTLVWEGITLLLLLWIV